MKNISELLQEIIDVVNDVDQTSFDFVDCKDVPNIEDSRLTFGYDREKKGLHIKTCVLYVDVRNSVKLTHENTIKKMGKVFTAFTKTVLIAAYHHGGHVRNIIGDRVMVVFPERECFKNAIECAITINHIAKKILNRKLYDIDFRCGIGIDYGEMYAIKAGIQKRGAEREEHRRLIWLGLPANNASRLTDQANKEIPEIRYKIKALVRKIFWPGQREILQQPYETRDMTMPANEIVEDVLNDRIHQATIFEKDETWVKFPSILISEKVYEEYKKACPNCRSIRENFWQRVPGHIPDIDYAVYGADIVWG